jgi:hypothetical protein
MATLTKGQHAERQAIGRGFRHQGPLQVDAGINSVAAKNIPATGIE